MKGQQQHKEIGKAYNIESGVRVLGPSHLEVWHDVEVVPHDEVDAILHTIDLGIADGTRYLHRIDVYGYHCMERVKEIDNTIGLTPLTTLQ